MLKNKRIITRLLTLYIVVVLGGIAVALWFIVKQEVQTSKYQARYLSAISNQLSFKVESGVSSSIRFPKYGPYDQRLGYTLLPEFMLRLLHKGYNIASQAASSSMMNELVDFGLYNVYHEKNQAGLRIMDATNQELFHSVYPAHGYPNFEAVPPLVLNTLLFIENRELLDETHAFVNPAVEWDRLGFAGLQLVAKKLGADINVPGGSTLATQLEKYRHSPDGYTRSVVEKFRQMGSASVRAYLLGPDTRTMRKEIALSYLNSMPLAATAKVGEIHGLGDGLSAWFGADFSQVNRLLSADAFKTTEHISPEQGQAYRQVLSLFLSQRRPSYLLGSGHEALEHLTDKYLHLLAAQGVIPTALRDAALQTPPPPLKHNVAPSRPFAEQKTQAVLRTRLAQTLGIKSIYELDRLDLTATTTLDYNTQQAVTEALYRLSDPENARSAGVIGFRLLNQSNDLSPITYSLMLFERGKAGNLLRIQTDNYDQPLDINEGIKIDLGSTAKLRTMVHYLELITEIYQEHKDKSAQELGQIELHPRDFLSAWVIEQLRLQSGIGLEDLLNKALDRRYSASPGEYFFTGGGLHHFANFTRNENGKIMSVRDALRDSVNLVFIRLMRDVVYHHLYKPDGLARWLEIEGDPRRQEYLERFADREGRIYLRRFYARYQGKTSQEAFSMLTQRVYPKASRLTMLYQAVYPDNDITALSAFLKEHLPATDLDDEDIYELQEKYSPAKFDLQDQGYITKIHPLELWLVGYLAKHPDATRQDILAASAEQRLEVYRWLFKSSRKNAQHRRIMTLLEIEAFNAIHTAWKRVGYPFETITPSYATSIGASGDRPAALAELMGILQADGRRLPFVRFDSLHYAAATPYETLFTKQPDQGQQVLAPEIARVARGALVGVVEGGTAIRLKGVYTQADGKLMTVGGKTGTGDHRRTVWGEKGRLIGSKFISRAATFVFFLGDRFFGVMTAYIEGEEAEHYHFTSALPVQIMKFLKPTLSPLLNRTPGEGFTVPLPKVTLAKTNDYASSTYTE